jgi:hypothetical protein
MDVFGKNILNLTPVFDGIYTKVSPDLGRSPGRHPQGCLARTQSQHTEWDRFFCAGVKCWNQKNMVHTLSFPAESFL